MFSLLRSSVPNAEFRSYISDQQAVFNASYPDGSSWYLKINRGDVLACNVPILFAFIDSLVLNGVSLKFLDHDNALILKTVFLGPHCTPRIYEGVLWVADRREEGFYSAF